MSKGIIIEGYVPEGWYKKDEWTFVQDSKALVRYETKKAAKTCWPKFPLVKVRLTIEELP